MGEPISTTGLQKQVLASRAPPEAHLANGFWRTPQGPHFEELVTKIDFGAENVIQGVLMVLRDFPENFLDSGGPC